MASDLMNPAQCNICEAAVAKFNCNTCGDALCATCKGYHLKSKGTKHHKVVPYAEKLNPKYLSGLLCPKHQTHGPKFWCNTCDLPICDSCITSNEHQGHQYSDITTTLSERRDAMLAEMKTLRDQTVGELEAVLTQAKEMTAKYQNNVDDIGKELIARAKEMHKQVDIILESSQKTLQKIKESGLAKLQQQEKFLEDKLCQMKEAVEKYENQLRDADPYAVLQFKPHPGQSKDTTKPPALETQSPPVFSKGQIDINAVEKMFGQLSVQSIPGAEIAKKPSAGQSSPQLARSSQSSEAEVSPSGAHSADSGTKRSLIPNPSVQYEFDVSHYDPQIACVESGQTWVRTKIKKLQLVDREGSVRDTINIDFDINGMAVTFEGELLLSDVSKKCIKSVSKQKEMSILFKTRSSPYNLCCLHNGDIVVAFPSDSKVVIFSRTGEIRQTLDHIKIRVPMSVSVNKVNKDIYICDHENSWKDSAGKVIAIGADYKHRYEYTGQGDSKFTPLEMCTDQMGHVLIIDYINNRVHILDQEGRFIQPILTSKQGLHQPTTIDVDREGYMWVGGKTEFRKDHVKVVRYLH